MKDWSLDLGANLTSEDTALFKVWAPFLATLDLKIQKQSFSSQIPMKKDDKGYFHLKVNGVQDGDRYFYILPNGQKLADPVSRWLPDGIEGSSAIVDPSFSWGDQQWIGIDQDDLVFYECHVGTFTPKGNFQGVIEKIPYLKELGINCIELMPIAQFPGRWGWGYDVANPYAVHCIYGNPKTLKQLVNACHSEGIAVCLDVVYNHFAPTGCNLAEFGPYFSERHRTPWGKAINYEEAYADEVRHFILQNALYWIHEYHIDALRLDALHAIYDFSESPLLKELSEAVEKSAKQLKKKVFLIAESDINDSRFIRSRRKEGMGIDALWTQDFHHALHVCLTDEKEGYYQDFKGLKDLKTALSHGVVYEGKYSPYRKRTHGNSFRGIRFNQLISFLQNHDQIGNRPLGNRLSTQLSFEKQKTAAFLLLLSPYIPLLFMGQEYGEEAPFEYFVDYEEELFAIIYEGRKKEHHLIEGELPVPDKSAYLRSMLRWDIEHPQKNAHLLLYRHLINFRQSHEIFKNIKAKNFKVYASLSQGWLAWEFLSDSKSFGFFCQFAEKKEEMVLPFSSKGKIEMLFHTELKEFSGENAISFDAKSRKLSIEKECGIAFAIT